MNDASQSPRIEARLIVKDAARAIEFYEKALGAKCVERFADPNLDDLVVHAKLQVGSASFTLAGEHKEWNNLSPQALGGSATLLTLEVEDADATGKRMVDAGAEVVVTIADQFYGKREGRLRDPFGHLWIISQHLEDLSPDEIQRRVDTFSA